VLTADLVSARRRGNELRLVALDDDGRARAAHIAARLIAVTASHVGLIREELEAALDAVDVGPREHRLKDGLVKLLLDLCELDAAGELDPEEVRRDVFRRASLAREALESGRSFDRAAVLASVSEERRTDVPTIERALFADLKGAHVLRSFAAPSAAALVSSYERSQAQAVLLRAVKVTVDVRSATPGALRALFRRLKFLRLLHAIARRDEGHRIVIDGPMSLFESGTKYGLQLALLLPLLEDCEDWQLEADIRWGKERTPLAFRLSGGASRSTGGAPESSMPDGVLGLVKSFTALGTSWRVSPNDEILDLPGVGLCIPDLVFQRGREKVYLEVMGYWSRASVWQRVELVERGLRQRILFAVSSRLRVSEEVLGPDLPGALYVYKGTMSARAIAERLGPQDKS
jgi:predicted nuclease of restriction endonuclease-like RecB superfamily